eukprot:COSAG01_NODE_475_length_16519_cov_168.890621_10_plen_262_part_00
MPKKGGGGGKEDDGAEDKQQAVVIAMSVELSEAFAPLSLEMAPALFPLANVPLIDYTMEALISAGVKEIFVFCGGGAHGTAIRAHLQGSAWGKKLKAKDLHCILGDKSVGDCLRECDDLRSAARINNGDLIVVTGPLVSNHDITAALQEHKSSRKRDKSTIMTLSLKCLTRSHRSRSTASDTIWGYDSDSHELVLFDGPERDGAAGGKHLKVETDVIKPHRSLDVRADLVDARLYICTPQVLIEFVSNFDFNTMDQFIFDM